MNFQWLKWPVVLGLSVMLHAVFAASFHAPTENETEIEGGATMQVASLGDASADSQAAGTPEEDAEPLQNKEIVDPAVSEKSEDVSAVESTDLPTFEPVKKDEPLKQSSPLEAEQDVQQDETLQPDEPEKVETAEDLAALVPDVAIVPIPQQRKANQPKKKAKTKPSPKNKNRAKKVVKKKASKKVEKIKKPVKQTRKKAGGNQGRQKTDKVAGKSNGKRKANSGNQGKNRRHAKAGNAAVSNYPGKVLSKIRRSKVRPKGKREKGRAIVAFTVSRSGAVSGIRIANSSGSSSLDKAALSTVKRAAPFPKIPAGAGRSKWAFKVPITFK